MRGAPFVIDGVTHYFRGTISVISADNPASAALGGFKQSASAFRFCRHCLGSEADIQSKVQLFVCMCWSKIILFNIMHMHGNVPYTGMYANMFMFVSLCSLLSLSLHFAMM